VHQSEFFFSATPTKTEMVRLGRLMRHSAKDLTKLMRDSEIKERELLVTVKNTLKLQATLNLLQRNRQISHSKT
jgi:hypothetical protein